MADQLPPRVEQVRRPSVELRPETVGSPERPEPVRVVEPEKPTPAEVIPAIPVRPASPLPSPAEDTSLFVQEVEQVLAEGLEETYRQLDPGAQAVFKRAGEETAKKIVTLLEQTKVQAKKVLELIVSWLKLIPGVNRFFLEQEAKIKADKLLALRRPPGP